MKKLGFGFMRLPMDGNDIDMNHVNKMVDAFMEKGFNYFDTAYIYHGGLSEVKIKEAVVDRYPRDAFKLATKMPISGLQSADEQPKIFSEQLERTGAGYFDYYLVHGLNADNYKKATEFKVFEFLQDKKENGKIKKLGFSYHDNADLLEKILKDHPEMEFVQLQINYLDWEDKNIQARKCYEVARKYNKEVIIMEPLKGGSLVNVPEEVETLFTDHHKDLSIASWGLRYAASLEGVIMVLSGMSTLGQLEDNVSFMADLKPLNEAEYQVIEKAVKVINEAITVPCTACRYCVDDCPMQIAIPEYFSLYNNYKQTKEGIFPIQKIYYNNYIKDNGKASDCIECKLCEHHCPQQINITEFLKEVSQAFE